MREQSDLLDSEVIKGMLSQASLGRISKLILLEEVDSTNSRLQKELNGGMGPVLVCVADQQTAGRGRSGKIWHSPLTKNIYFSISWEYAISYQKVEGLSLAIGVVVLDSLISHGYPELKLKWPNDILFDGAKLGGILVEIIGGADSSLKIIVGVGINVNMSAKQGSVIERAWTDLSSIRHKPPPSRNELLATLIDRLIDLFLFYPEKGFPHWRDSWNARDSFMDKNAQIISNGEILLGICRGVDSKGRLILDSSEGLLFVAAGDVSLREP